MKGKYYEDYKKEFIEHIESMGIKHGKSSVFGDYLTIAACTISNSVDPVHYNAREQLYMDTIKKYSKEEVDVFVKMHCALVMALQKSYLQRDVLGEIFHELALQNEWNGQFFSPIHICKLMAEITLSNSLEKLEDKPYITLCEPTCGSGTMVIAIAGVLYDKKLNPADKMCVLAVDNDTRCAMMTYIQLSYLGIPAVVVHGDSLLIKEYQRFYTPIYVMNNWVWRERLAMTDEICLDDEKLKCAFEPMYALIKYGKIGEKQDESDD